MFRYSDFGATAMFDLLATIKICCPERLDPKRTNDNHTKTAIINTSLRCQKRPKEYVEWSGIRLL